MIDRRYSEHGKMAHLIVVGRPGYLCGARGSRLGAEGEEREIAAEMALCPRCDRKADDLRDDPDYRPGWKP